MPTAAVAGNDFNLCNNFVASKKFRLNLLRERKWILDLLKLLFQVCVICAKNAENSENLFTMSTRERVQKREKVSVIFHSAAAAAAVAVL